MPPEAGCLVDLSPYPGGHRALQKSVKTELNGEMPSWHHMSGVRGWWGVSVFTEQRRLRRGKKLRIFLFTRIV